MKQIKFHIIALILITSTALSLAFIQAAGPEALLNWIAS